MKNSCGLIAPVLPLIGVCGILSCTPPELKENQDAVRADLRETMDHYDKAFRECYQAAVRAEKAAPTGEIKIRFVIKENGQTAGVKIQTSSLGSPGTEMCVIEVVKGVRFKSLNRGYRSEVVYPLSFGEVAGNKPAPAP